jgi:hypothetical protein
MVSCHFGNFLYNCERDRVTNRVFERTESIWTYIEAHRMDFENPVYFKRTKSVTSKEYEEFEKATLFPVVTVKRLRLWTSFFHRWDVSSKAKVHSISTTTSTTESSSQESSGVTVVRLEASASLNATEMLMLRIAELERQLKECQVSNNSAPASSEKASDTQATSELPPPPPPPPPAAPIATSALSAQSRRYSTFNTHQHTEGVDCFTKRLSPNFVGSVHGFSWSTMTNNLETPPAFADASSNHHEDGTNGGGSGSGGGNGNGNGGVATAQELQGGSGSNQRMMASTVWVPDELAFKCAKCSISFTVFTRKHHCRGCCITLLLLLLFYKQSKCVFEPVL